jgi:protein MpaA
MRLSRRRAVALGLGAVTATTLTGQLPADARPLDQRIDDGAAGSWLVGRIRRSAPSRSWTTMVIGTSVQGRPVELRHSPAVDTERHRVLVVAGVHGNEPITGPLAAALGGASIPRDVSVSIVPMANPDGTAADTRHNADGVDLNRNFPWRWSRSDGGPAAGSAPETQALMGAVMVTAPSLAVWVHQPLGYVSPLSGCPVELADAWRNQVGDRRRDGIDQHGGGETWCARVADVPTLLVEVATWAVTERLIDAHTRGFVETLRVLAS